MTSPAKRPWHMFYPLAGIILLCLVWSGYWYVAFNSTKELTQSKRQELRGIGLELTCAQESWGGFPFRFEFQCEAASLSYIHNNETLNLQSTKIVAVAQAYNPAHILLLIDGPTLLTKAKTDIATLAHERALISITFNHQGEWDVSSEVAKVNAQGLFSAASLNFYARQIKDKLDLAANAERLVILGPNNSLNPITKAEVIAHTSAAFLNTQSPLDYAASTSEPLTISALKISTGPVNFDAQGEVFLDSNHRLNGKLSSQTNDIDGLLNFITPIFELKGKDKAAMKSLLGLVGNDQNTTTKKADFTAKNGTLSWGPFKLADLKPLY